MTPKELKNINSEAQKIIRAFCDKTNTSLTALAIDADIHPAQLLKFMRNEQGLTANTLAKLGAFIDKSI